MSKSPRYQYKIISIEGKTFKFSKRHEEMKLKWKFQRKYGLQ